MILKQQLAETEGQLAVRQERKTGQRVVLKGVAHISSKQILNLLTKCAENTQTKKISVKKNTKQKTVGIEDV